MYREDGAYRDRGPRRSRRPSERYPRRPDFSRTDYPEDMDEPLGREPPVDEAYVEERYPYEEDPGTMEREVTRVPEYDPDREPVGPEGDETWEDGYTGPPTEEGGGMSKETLAMVAGVLYMLMATYLFFMFFWRDGGREIVIFEFALSLIVIAIGAVFLALAPDLRFMPDGTPAHWTSFASGILTMVVVIIIIKVFKDFNTGEYDILDDVNVVVSVALGAGATYLLLHSIFYEREEEYFQERTPISFLSGFSWAGLVGFIYYFFVDEPFTRLADVPLIFGIGVAMAVLGALAVFFNLLDDTYFAPRWATKKHMNFVSGILLGVILFLVLIAGLMFNSEPYVVWDTARVATVSGIGAFSMFTAMFSMAM